MVFIQETIYLKKRWAYVINPDACKSITTHSINLHVNRDVVT